VLWRSDGGRSGNRETRGVGSAIEAACSKNLTKPSVGGVMRRGGKNWKGLSKNRKSLSFSSERFKVRKGQRGGETAEDGNLKDKREVQR